MGVISFPSFSAASSIVQLQILAILTRLMRMFAGLNENVFSFKMYLIMSEFKHLSVCSKRYFCLWTTYSYSLPVFIIRKLRVLISTLRKLVFFCHVCCTHSFFNPNRFFLKLQLCSRHSASCWKHSHAQDIVCIVKEPNMGNNLQKKKIAF